MSNQDKKVLLEKRISHPMTLASAMGGVLEIFGGRAADADIAKNWNDIVGKKISDIASLVAIRQNKDKKINVVVRPINPAFALELSYMVEEIKSKINKYYGCDKVNKITIRK